MPNWCNNTFELIGKKEEIAKFEKFLVEKDGKDWFDYFAPCPQELKDVGNVSLYTPEEQRAPLVEKYGYSDWYSFGIGEWGCKWNCDANDWTVDDYDEENDVIRFWFDSPWGPPEALYENLSNGKYGEWYAVFAEWHEEGMAFVGRWDDGSSENYEYSDLESLDDIPEDLVENWNLREMLEDREEWDEDEEELISEDEAENDSEEVPDASEQDLEKSLAELKKEFEEMMQEGDKPVKESKKWPM